MLLNDEPQREETPRERIVNAVLLLFAASVFAGLLLGSLLAEGK